MNPEANDLSLDDLCRDASRFLRDLGSLEAMPDGRVTPAPDARTVRYYGTLGLIDRPRIENREARYGWRHLLQLVAIKALQHLGLPLVQIQQRLFGRTEAELEQLLRAAAAERATPKRTSLPAAPAPLTWHEIAVEPGIRLMIQAGSPAPADPDALARRVASAIAAFSQGGNPSC